MKPKKLIRSGITEKLKEGEWETIADQEELNRLYAIKIREELAEIQASDHKDIFEFVDLIQVAFSFAKQNGFAHEQLSHAMMAKSLDKGSFGRLALNNLNPDNPSNKLYLIQRTMEYFGTNLTEWGHYRWLLTEQGMQKQWNKFDELPFHPENLTNNLPKGEIVYYQGGGFTVLAIAGSPKDTRPGTKSVFWVKLKLDRDEMIEFVKQNKTAMSLINSMPFSVAF